VSAHAHQAASHHGTTPVGEHNVPSVHPFRLFILTERPDARGARILRKRRVRDALAAAGCSKQAWIASVLGVSQQFVQRCLSEHHRAELSPRHLARLGVVL
jgi:hypothetical protein